MRIVKQYMCGLALLLLPLMTAGGEIGVTNADDLSVARGIRALRALFETRFRERLPESCPPDVSFVIDASLSGNAVRVEARDGRAKVVAVADAALLSTPGFSADWVGMHADAPKPETVRPLIEELVRLYHAERQAEAVSAGKSRGWMCPRMHGGREW